MPSVSNPSPRKGKFIPNIENYKTSLSYEGITQKDKNKARSISELKRKYAR